MLRRLQVRSFAVLDELELDLTAGFTALTGETGAGKSLLVDALALALGERADSNTVRSGESRAEVIAHFSTETESASRRWLVEHDLDDGEECQLRRVVTTEGRSRAYINGRPVPIDMLREIGAGLVEICGQHEHQALVRRPAQRDFLDSFGEHASLLGQIQLTHAAWSSASAELAALSRSQSERQDRLALLSYQVRELAGLALGDGEVEALEQERQVLANVSKIAAGLATALDATYDADDGSAQSVLSAAGRTLAELAEIDPELVDAAAELDEAVIHLRESADQMRRRLGRLEHDPRRLQEIERRLATIDDLARKHRCEPASLCHLGESLQQHLDQLGGNDQRLAQLQPELERCRSTLNAALTQLHAARIAASRELAKSVNQHLKRLGMPAAELAVRVDPLPLEEAGVHGADDIEFLIRTSADQPPGPVARVASGGELSRLTLALRLAAIGNGGPPTLIFDEVDAGTGGGVAETIGQSLHQLAQGRQVLCVTHLPQVASLADQHCLVEKSTVDGSTRTAIRSLTRQARVDEVARMLGGIRITDRARAHAREMLSTQGKKTAV